MRVEFTGKVIDGDEVLFEEVSGYYVISRGANLHSWSGVLTIESGEEAFMFRNARLIFDDCKSGDIFALSTTLGGSTIEFQGAAGIDEAGIDEP